MNYPSTSYRNTSGWPGKCHPPPLMGTQRPREWTEGGGWRSGAYIQPQFVPGVRRGRVRRPRRQANNNKDRIKAQKKLALKCMTGRCWNKQDAERALQAESQVRRRQAHSLIIRFPDAEISVGMIKSLHAEIEKVHIQVPLQPRYCVIRLAEDSDVNEVIKNLDYSDFYNLGKIRVERKAGKQEENLTPEMIDPYTLYVGNIPATVPAEEIKRKFFLSSRVDVGFSCRMNFTKYAFIKYHTVEEAIEAFRSTQDSILGNRTLIVRFRRREPDPESATENRDALKAQLKPKRLREFQALDDLPEDQERNVKENNSKLNLKDIFGSFNFCQDDDQISDEDKGEVDDDDDDDDDDEDDGDDDDDDDGVGD